MLLRFDAEVDGTNPVNDIIDIGEVKREETKSVLGDMKSAKTPGIDSITADPLKADTDTTVNTLHGPEDWSKGRIVKLSKNEDLTSCGNWRGFTLTSIVAKVLGRVLIKRIVSIVARTDAELRGEQPGLRSGRSTTEQIFVLIEQVVELNSSLFLCFVDYEKAFESINRDILWQPRSQGLSLTPPPRARERDPGWVWSRATQNLGGDKKFV